WRRSIHGFGPGAAARVRTRHGLAALFARGSRTAEVVDDTTVAFAPSGYRTSRAARAGLDGRRAPTPGPSACVLPRACRARQCPGICSFHARELGPAAVPAAGRASAAGADM